VHRRCVGALVRECIRLLRKHRARLLQFYPRGLSSTRKNGDGRELSGVGDYLDRLNFDELLADGKSLFRSNHLSHIFYFGKCIISVDMDFLEEVRIGALRVHLKRTQLNVFRSTDSSGDLLKSMCH